MIPYLAVIKDSFRAAWQSMTLRTLFVIVTLLLLAIVPFGYTQTLTGHLRWREIYNWREMMDVLYAARDSGESGPKEHVWSMLNPHIHKEADAVYKKLQEEAEAIATALEAGEDPPEFDLAQQHALNNRFNTLLGVLHRDIDDNLLTDPDFYDEAAWEGIDFPDELKERLAEDPATMSEVELRRRNRLLLELGFPGIVPRSPPVAVKPTYFGWTIPGTDGNTKDAAIEWYRGSAGWMMDWPVSMTLVFIAIIATSGIMPRMFEPGSISLLLSKPITRSRLFLSQFLGACTFMLLASIYFTVGVWLIAAIRLGIYNPNMFWCIPLFTFMFMVYYSVTAYVGIVYRSAIISVIATVLMFYLCFFVGWAKVTYDDWNVDAARFVHVVDTGDTLVASDDPILGMISHYSFDEESREWKDIFQPQGFSFGAAERAIYDRPNDRLLAVENSLQGQSLSVGPAREAWVRQRGTPIPPETMDLLVESDGRVLAISRKGFFRLTGDATNPELIPGLPDEESLNSLSPEVNDHEPLTSEGGNDPTSENEPETTDTTEDPSDGNDDNGDGDQQPPSDESNDESNTEPDADDATSPDESSAPDEGDDPGEDADPSEAEDTATATGEDSPTDDPPTDDEPVLDPTDDARAAAEEMMMDVLSLKRYGAFERVGPEELPALEPPMSVAIGPANDRIFIYANGQMSVFDKGADGVYSETVRDDMVDGHEKAASLAVGSTSLLVARDDGKVFILNPETLEVEQEFSPEKEVPIRFVKTSASGRWVALLFPNRQLWLYDMRQKEFTKPGIWTQGDISAVGFSEDRLLIIDRIARVREFELPDLNQTRTFRPKRIPYLSDTTEFFGLDVNWFTFHRWVITPLYTILPKPGELGWAMNYLATGEQTDTGFFIKMMASVGLNLSREEGTGGQRQYVRDPWRGVRSCSIFIVFMLCLSCWQISRTEF